MTDKTKKIIARVILMIFLLPFVYAMMAYSWEQEELDNITVELKKYDSSWDYWKTVDLLKKASHIHNYIDSIGKVGMTIFDGKTIIVNGKDITGNLGNKTTYGSNSPIINNIEDSQVAIGEKAMVNVDNKKTVINIIIEIITNIYFSISMTIGLTISAIYNIILVRKHKKKALH